MLWIVGVTVWVGAHAWHLFLMFGCSMAAEDCQTSGVLQQLSVGFGVLTGVIAIARLLSANANPSDPPPSKRILRISWTGSFLFLVAALAVHGGV